jgi:multicomponent Na+:H+ antiporter subunit E
MTRLLRVIVRLPRIAWFTLVFLRAMVLANVRVAWEVLTPGFSMRAGIVRVPTDCTTEWEMFVLANTITMTPGTLSLEVDTGSQALFVHSLYVTSREEFVASIKQLERAMLKAMR